MEKGTDLDEAVQGLSSLIVAGDTFRLAASVHFGLGLVETYAISYLYDHGPMTQADLGRLMGITSGGITGVVDRLERSDTAPCAWPTRPTAAASDWS